MKKGLWVLLGIVLVGMGMWGFDQYRKNQQYNLYLENQFQRAFYDLLVDIENVQVNLAKLMVSATPKQNVMMLSEIRSLCYDAQEKLSQLPIDHTNVSKTQKFLSQVGDYSMALSRKNLEGKPLSAEEMKTLQELHRYSNILSQQLISLQKEMAQNGIKIGELVQKGNKRLEKTNQNMLTTNFLNVEEKMQKYPKLIYDGPFSEHIEQQKPNLKGKNITSQQAQRIAASFLEDQKYRAKEIGEIQNNSIPGYLIALSPAQDQEGNYSEISVAVSKTGGKIIWLLNNREIGKAKISEEEGIEIAKKFLEKKGYPNMLPTYFEKNDGQLLVNFAYQENGVIVYTDLIKVKVGLDKGDIIGFESAGYLHNHRMRNIGPPEISEEEARKRIHVFAEPSKPRLAIIPTEGGKEVLCYEFKVQFGQDTFLIYIDANNGEEQKILQLLIQDGGVLVI